MGGGGGCAGTAAFVSKRRIREMRGAAAAIHHSVDDLMKYFFRWQNDSIKNWNSETQPQPPTPNDILSS